MAVISRAQKERLTYRELDERSNALARGLRERGVKKGDRVAVSLGNNWEYAVTNYALYKLGAILVCVSTQLTQIRGDSADMEFTGALEPSVQLSPGYVSALPPLRSSPDNRRGNKSSLQAAQREYNTAERNRW